VLGADRPAYVAGRLLAARREGADADTVERTLQLHRATVRKHVAQLGVSVLEVPEEYSGAIQESLRRTGLFQYVERDFYAQIAGTPNDPKYPSQWHLPKIRGPQAWGTTTGAASVLVAVIDSGVEAAHPDLASKLVPGWNFLNGNSNTNDEVGHGTAVAGTLAAASDNGVGVAGVSWGSPILPLAVVGSNETAAYSDIAAAIQYAADHGARIINISIGGPAESMALQSAADYAWAKGALIFASAMNAGTSAPYYPAACNHVVAVAATDATDHLASFSNHGNWITLSAPGVGILSTSIGGGYGYWDGTSFASPIAAGVAALALAVEPSLTNAELLKLLASTADDLGPPGPGREYGWGVVNAYKAVQAASQSAGQSTGRTRVHPSPRLHPPDAPPDAPGRVR